MVCTVVGRSIYLCINLINFTSSDRIHLLVSKMCLCFFLAFILFEQCFIMSLCYINWDLVLNGENTLHFKTPFYFSLISVNIVLAGGNSRTTPCSNIFLCLSAFFVPNPLRNDGELCRMVLSSLIPAKVCQYTNETGLIC